jgi:methionyl aminopeptidase
MKIKQQNNLINSFISLKTDDWLERQRIAGKVVAKTLEFLANLVKNKSKLSLIEMSCAADELIRKHNCTSTFLNYRGFPAAVCISVNKQLVHGIPTDYQLEDGDLVSFDLGATYEGVIADAARTYIYGEPKSKEHIKLIETTKLCLSNAINSASIDKQIGVIGNTIYKTAQGAGFNIIEKYGGHGICCNKPHAEPFVSNKANKSDGVRIQSGMTLAIEPLLVIGKSNITHTASDGWTVYCDDICAHEEHTIFIHQNKIEILTDINNYI